MQYIQQSKLSRFFDDSLAGLAVFLVAIPLCLGIAIASGVPLLSGIISGIIGGIIVGLVSNSQVSVSGPSAGLFAVILMLLSQVSGYESFLTVIAISGVLQIIMGFIGVGIIADYIPSNVIKGLLGAIGIIMILKQIPHFFGYTNSNPEGIFSFWQSNGENTISSIFNLVNHIEYGSTFVGIVSFSIMMFWPKIPSKLTHKIPSPIIVVILAIFLSDLFYYISSLSISDNHLVNLPIITEFRKSQIEKFITTPEISAIFEIKTYMLAAILAVMTSIETLVNIESTDKIDPKHRRTNRNRELFAQGIGNTISGIAGGLPISSVVIRSSVSISAGAKTKAATIIHGILLLLATLTFPALLNKIPISALAAILMVTGMRLIHFNVFVEIYKRGPTQFIPFMVTMLAILFTDLLTGVLIGISSSALYILKRHHMAKFSFIIEKYLSGEVIRVDLPHQVSFLNKPSLIKMLHSLPRNSHAVLDARNTEYIDYDILEFIREFKITTMRDHHTKISLLGFKKKYDILKLEDCIHFTSVITKDVQNSLTPDAVIQILKDGNQRFVENKRIDRNLLQQVKESAGDQHPVAAIVGCIDSRTSSEFIFDVGFGDIFSIRIAGNVVNDDIIGSLEFACKIAGAKLIMILGHTNCGAIKAACDNPQLSGLTNLTSLLDKIKPAIASESSTVTNRNSSNDEFVSNVTILNILNTKNHILAKSPTLSELIVQKQIKIIGGIYDVQSGEVRFDI